MLISSRANPYFVLFLPIHNPFWLISLDKMVSQSFYPFSIWSAESPGCGFPQILDLHRWLGGLLIIYLYLGNGSEFQLLLRLCCLIASARLGFRLYLNLTLFLFYFIWFLVIYFVLCVFWIPLHWEVMGGIAIAGCQDIAWMVIKMCGWNAQEKCPRTLINSILINGMLWATESGLISSQVSEGEVQAKFAFVCWISQEWHSLEFITAPQKRWRKSMDISLQFT